MARDERRHSRTKADLIDRVYQRHGGLTKSEAAEVVDTIFSTVKSALVEGRAVRIKNFGIWEVRPRPRRRGINPTNGEEIVIVPGREGVRSGGDARTPGQPGGDGRRSFQHPGIGECGYSAVTPPSIANSAPVTKEASSEARYSTP